MCLRRRRRRRRRFVVIVVVVVVFFFFPQRVFRLLCFRAFVALARSVDRSIARTLVFGASATKIFCYKYICGNKNLREFD
jgi:hypothetical protein